MVVIEAELLSGFAAVPSSLEDLKSATENAIDREEVGNKGFWLNRGGGFKP